MLVNGEIVGGENMNGKRKEVNIPVIYRDDNAIRSFAQVCAHYILCIDVSSTQKLQSVLFSSLY